MLILFYYFLFFGLLVCFRLTLNIGSFMDYRDSLSVKSIRRILIEQKGTRSSLVCYFITVHRLVVLVFFCKYKLKYPITITIFFLLRRRCVSHQPEEAMECPESPVHCQKWAPPRPAPLFATLPTPPPSPAAGFTETQSSLWHQTLLLLLLLQDPLQLVRRNGHGWSSPEL